VAAPAGVPATALLPETAIDPRRQDLRAEGSHGGEVDASSQPDPALDDATPGYPKPRRERAYCALAKRRAAGAEVPHQAMDPAGSVAGNRSGDPKVT